MNESLMLVEIAGPLGHIITEITGTLGSLMHGCRVRSYHVRPRRGVLTMLTRILPILMRVPHMFGEHGL